MEKYSTLMSLYNKENPKYLERSIQSIIEQSVKPDEIVIVKDGPITKELEFVLKSFQRKYPEIIKIVVSEKNIGLGLALNLGLKHCSNNLVARMDTDDVSLRDRCKRQLKAFRDNPNLDVLSGVIVEFIGHEDNIIGRRNIPISNEEIIKYMKTRCPVNHVAVMFKKSKVIEAGGYQDWFWNEDYYLWIRMYETGCVFGNLEEVLVNVRVGKDMYKRRGGIRYFKSEAKLQKYMYRHRIINIYTFIYNILVRFIFQVILPNKLRGFLFKKLARSSN